MRVFFSNLGCKLNQAEIDSLARRFAQAGHEVAGSLTQADLHVVNTCSVTHAAARDSRKLARRGGRLRPDLKTVLTGCWVADEPEVAATLAGVDLVVPNQDKEGLLEAVHRAFPEATKPIPVPYVPLDIGRTRALVKVEDGCDMRCSFCIIPRTRGEQRSISPDRVVDEVRSLVADGFREVVITGVQISSYLNCETGLAELVNRLLEETSVERLRLTSIAPWDFDPRLLDLLDSGRICRHFHLSLQSGCDTTLKHMRRPYTAARFADLVAKIRRRSPTIALTTDVIVGFPGETEAHFEASLEVVAALEFAQIHAFPFSPRNGTAAVELPDRLEPPVIRDRMRQMLDLADHSRRRYLEQRLGERATVLWESRRLDRSLGTTDHYVRVETELPIAGLGALQQVILSDLTDLGIRGVPLATEPAVAS